MCLESIKNLFKNNNFLEYVNFYFVFGFSLTIILLFSYFYILFQVLPFYPQYSSAY